MLRIIPLVLVSLAGLLAGCAGNRNKPSEVRIGAIFSMTGEVAGYGQRSHNGLQMAVDELNARSEGSAPRFRVSLEDAKSDPKAAVAAYQKLVSAGGTKLIIGDVYSSTTLAIAPMAEQDRVLLLAPGASNPKMRDMGDYIFRNWTSDEYDGKAMADYVSRKMRINSVAVIYQQVDYTLGLASAFKAQLEALGGKVTAWEAVSPGAPEARQVVTKVLQSRPPAVYVCATSKESGIVVKDLREARYTGKIIANLTVESPEFLDMAKAYADGIVYSTPAFDPDDRDARVQRFISSYKKAYGSAPDAAAGHAYDAVYILAEAIKRAGSSEPGKVRDALYGIRDFPGVTGRTTFDKHGDVTKDILVKRIEKGKPVKLERYGPGQ